MFRAAIIVEVKWQVQKHADRPLRAGLTHLPRRWGTTAICAQRPLIIASIADEQSREPLPPGAARVLENPDIPRLPGGVVAVDYGEVRAELESSGLPRVRLLLGDGRWKQAKRAHCSLSFPAHAPWRAEQCVVVRRVRKRSCRCRSARGCRHRKVRRAARGGAGHRAARPGGLATIQAVPGERSLSQRSGDDPKSTSWRRPLFPRMMA